MKDVFDPCQDYYRVLEVDRLVSQAELRKAYKRLALRLHPDKLRAASEEQQQAVAAQFKAVVEAYDVLSDESRRASYDRTRAQLKGGGASASGPRTAEEAAALLRGLRELAKMRREGMRRNVKHAPLLAEVRVSLAKLHRGCTKSVCVLRTTVDPTGQIYEESKTFHLVVRRGATGGTRFVFDSQGSETVELLPGDVIITLREKPCKHFRRDGPKDLLRIGAPLGARDAMYCEVLQTLSGHEVLLVGSAVAPPLAAGGQGGFVEHLISCEGMPDPVDPWEFPKGDLRVRLRYEPRAPSSWCMRTLRPRPILLVGCTEAAVPAAAAGGIIGAGLKDALLAGDLEERESVWSACAVCLVVDAAQPSDAAQALMAACSATLRCVRWRQVRVSAREPMLADDEWCALYDARCVVVDACLASDESHICGATAQLHASGVMEAIWCRHWLGAYVAAIGDAVALISADVDARPHALLPMPVRVGGGEAGWGALHAAMAGWPADAAGVGVLRGSAMMVDASVWWGAEGAAELLCAPTREVLKATAAAGGAHRFDEALEEQLDLGFAERTSRQLCLRETA